MGRRKKAAKKAVKKKKATVAKVFKCILCNHEDTVTCQMDYKNHIANLNCRVCDAKYQTNITDLSDPIDVFSEWLDGAEEKQLAELGTDGEA